MEDSNICENTKKTYLSCLSSIKSLNINISEIDNLENIIQIFKNNNLSLSTIKNYLNSLLWFSKENNLNLTIQKEISEIIFKIRKKQEEELKMNNLSENEKLKFVSWEIIIEIHNKLKQLYDENKENAKLFKYYVILSFYVYMPPRRIMDYVNLYYDNTKKIDQDKVIKYQDNKYKCDSDHNFDFNLDNDNNDEINGSDDNKNYFVKEGQNGYFIFNNYKTKKTYSSQYLQINPLLSDLLGKYIVDNNIINGNNILKITCTNLIFILNKIFMIYINRKISVTALRHIYITNELNNEPSKIIVEKEKLANQMAHSLLLQSLYYKKVNINDSNFNPMIKTVTILELFGEVGRKKIYLNKDIKQKVTNENKKNWYNKNKEKVAAQRTFKRLQLINDNELFCG